MSTEPSAPQSLRGRSFAETSSAVLDLIRSSGEITRVELSRRAALTEATISKVVKDLLAKGVIVESGRTESTGGKPATLLRLDTSTLWSVGVVLDLTHIVVVLCAIDGSRVSSVDIRPAPDDDPDEILRRVAAAILELLDGRTTAPGSAIGIGVALAGRRGYQDPEAVVTDWTELTPVDVRLAELTGIEVLLENDANCAALNEFWSGGIAAGHDFAVVYAADGIGAGIVIDGDVYRGRSAHAGEIGHVYVDRGQTPCWCGRQGCLEVTGTPQAVARRVSRTPDLMAELGLAADASPRSIYAAVAASAAAGGPTALAVIQEAAEYLATAVVGMANTLDLDLVFLAGPGFAEAGQIFLGAVRAALDTSYVHTLHPVEVQLRSVDPNAAAVGAASLVLHRRLTPHHTA
jgi:predicted NBD/HSP70 family sugar kinase